MDVRILYFGSEFSVLDSLFSNTPPPNVFSTTRVSVAINEILDRNFDCLLFGDIADTPAMKLLLHTATIIDDRLPIVCLEGEDRRLNAAVRGLVTSTVSPQDVEDLHSALELQADDPEVAKPDRHPILESIHEHSPSRALAHVNRQGEYLWTNDRMDEMIGLTELDGATIADHPPEGASQGIAEIIQDSVETGEVQWTGAESAPYDRIFCVYPIEGEGALLITHSPEVTLAFGGEYLNRLADMFFIIDFDGNFVYWNNSVNSVTGYSDAELLQMQAFELIAEEDRPRAREKLKTATTGSEAWVEIDLVTKSGTQIPYQFSGSLINGRDGEPRYVCGVGRDISRRVAMREEIESVIEQLEESNAELERFAYVASHDLREPLRMVRSYLDLLQRRHREDLDEDAQDFVDYALEGSRRMQALIKDLLEYSRIGIEVRNDRVDCNEVLADVQDNLQVAIAESNAEIDVDELPAVAADRTLLVQLFQNLISNAIEHGKHAPHIHVTADREDNRWRFAIADNNEANPALDDEIFELFSSGNGKEGFGLGLAICRKIVETFDGEIRVESAPDTGSTFYFTLPAADEQVATPLEQ